MLLSFFFLYMFYISFISSIYLLIKLLSTNLYKIKNNYINKNISIYKYGIVYNKNSVDENSMSEIIEYITFMYDIPCHIYNMVNLSNNESTLFYHKKSGWALYYDMHKIIFFKLHDLRQLITNTNETINTTEWKYNNDINLIGESDINNMLDRNNNIIIHESLIKSVNISASNNITQLLQGHLYYYFSNNMLLNEYTNIPSDIIDILTNKNESSDNEDSEDDSSYEDDGLCEDDDNSKCTCNIDNNLVDKNDCDDCDKNDCDKNDCDKNDCSKNDCSKNDCDDCSKNDCDDCSKNDCSTNDCSKNDCDKNDCSKNDCSTNDCSTNDCSKNDCSKNDCSKNDCNIDKNDCSNNDNNLVDKTECDNVDKTDCNICNNDCCFEDNTVGEVQICCNKCYYSFEDNTVGEVQICCNNYTNSYDYINKNDLTNMCDKKNN